MSVEQVKTPDIGGESGEIIEILVAVGDQVEAEQSLVVLESAKASMEVPSPKAGKVAKLHVSVGDNLEEGNPILDLELESEAADQESAEAETDSSAPEEDEEKPADNPEQLENKDKEQPQPAAIESKGRASQVIKVPDIGSDSAEVIELAVKAGDSVSAGDTLVVAESEKASMEIPADVDGIIESLHVKVGDRISEGQDLAMVSARQREEAAEVEESEGATEAGTAKEDTETVRDAENQSPETSRVLLVPDLGSESAEIIEIPIKVGDSVKEGDTLVVAESDKASLEIPAQASGEVVAIHCAVGDKISEGAELVSITSADASQQKPSSTQSAESDASESVAEVAQQPASEPAPKQTQSAQAATGDFYAGPAVRKLAREFGIDLAKVSATGPRGRILKEDLHKFVKGRLKEPAGTGSSGLPAVPEVDWSKFGTVHEEVTSRIHRLTADNMRRSWLNVPHVTQFDDADVTELEEYRAMLKHEGAARGIKMTPLAFILKASYKALKDNPKFNAALSGDSESLIYRDYFHIGVAVDTPAGLMVPVIRDVDQKDIWQMAKEIAELAEKAKNAKLKPTEMQGACFTVSSLGAIGGKGFTPIVPTPQVGILGVSKTSVQPVWDGESFQPRKLMPLALSYDHRAVNGADAGKFLTYLVEQLSAVKNIWSD